MKEKFEYNIIVMSIKLWYTIGVIKTNGGIMKNLSKEKKKSLIIVISLSVILIAMLGILLFMEISKKKEASELMDSFYETYESKDLEVIYYASSSCGYCTMEQPILDTIANDYDIEYLSIDVTKLSYEERKEIADELDIEGGTPTTVVTKNGKVIAKQEGFVEGSAYVEFFISAGVLEEGATYSEESDLTFINYDEYKELIKSNEANIVVVGQTGCSYCTSAKPVLNKIAKKYDITINYLNIRDMDEDTYNEFKENLGKYGYDEESYVQEGSIGTPTTLIFKEEKVIDYIAGSVANVKYVNLFKKVGIINE